MARLKDITSTEKLLQVIRSRKVDLPPAEAGPAEPLSRITKAAPPLTPDKIITPESPVTAVAIGPAPPATDACIDFKTDEGPAEPVTLVIRDVRPIRPEAITVPEAVPIRQDMDLGGIADAVEPSGNIPHTDVIAISEASTAEANRDSAVEQKAPAAEIALPSRPKTRRFKVILPRFVPLQKTSTVGIDIGHDYLRLVRAVKTTSGKWEILDRRRFALPPKTSREAPEFSSFLKKALAAVCVSPNRADLWVNMSAAQVDVRHIRIPRVPRKQIANVVYWTIKRESPFDEKEMLLDFETQGEVIEQGIPKLAVMVYTAPRREIEELRELFFRIGWPLTGISIVPFSVQNLFRTGWIASREGSMASLFIGNDFSRIDIYSADNLVMTRGIKAGTSSMVEALVDRFHELHRRDASALTIEQGRKIVRSLSPDSPSLEEGDAGYELREEAVFEMIQPALERLTRQVERTFEHYMTTMPGERIVRIYVSGAMNVYQPIVDYVGSQLGISSAVLDPLSDHETAVCKDVDDANCISERIAFGPALGLALSDNHHTPNLMFTYKDKEREASVVRINRAVFVAFLVSVLLCAGIFIFQNHAIAQKKETLAGIETQISRLGLSVDKDQLMKMAGKIAQRQQLSRVYAARYLDVVLIGELAALTPSNIRFIDLKITRGGPAVTEGAATPAKEKGKEASKTIPEEIILEGLVLGDRQLLESTLAVYTMALEASPLFRKVIVQKNNMEPYLKNETLHFILNLKVEEQVHG